MAPSTRTKYNSVVFSALFVALVMVSNLRFSSMYLYYSIDREGFIEALCENTDRPELKCEGKCMLSQMLVSQDNEKELPMPLMGWEQVLFFLKEPSSYTVLDVKQTPKAYFHYTNNYSFNFSCITYKPPTV
ncbi:hypothetical protein [Flagellimonas sp.]|uniref:hypothetical protein n=1 Tax=Flagellimonas sp. TaxID=2058762 RepID=UPI003B5AB4C8